jgi:hypothetical protein
MQMRPLDPVPATRFDFGQAKDRARLLGQQIGGMTAARVPFDSQEECWLAYDRLPYLGEARAAERRLLAAIAAEATPPERRKDIEGDLARADVLAASGRSLDALREISKVYNSCVQILG